eukprot:g3059.t1
MSGDFYGPIENREEAVSRVRKGMSLFRDGDVSGSLREFDAAAALDKRAIGKLWQRGLSLFYSNEYDKAAEQFRIDVALNPADAEESIWHFMSAVESLKTKGHAPRAALEKARANGFLSTEVDAREVCEYALDLMKKGRSGAAKLRELARARNDEKDGFYANMYIGLYARLEDDLSTAETSLKRAVKSTYAKTDNDYMIAVATVALREVRARQSKDKTCVSPSPLPKDAYMTLRDGQRVCRVLVGMWQLSGAHGYEPEITSALKDMRALVANGFVTFDLADHYGPAEQYVGALLRSEADTLPPHVRFHTKWVPRPGDMSLNVVRAAIDVSRRKMNMSKLDLVAFHWWDYNDGRYLDMLRNAARLTDRVRAVSITNFDTKRTQEILDAGVALASNQVSFSVLDTRPIDGGMLALASKHKMALLCYGSLLGGFLSDAWLGRKIPTSRTDVPTASLSKYFRWIRAWGSWDLFQSLLRTLRKIADKHKLKRLSSVAVRWVLQQGEGVAVILGMRLGHTASKHIESNREIFGFELDNDDIEAIAAIQRKGNPLLRVLGDCGDEYRR